MKIFNDLRQFQKDFSFIDAVKIVLIPALIKCNTLKHKAILEYLTKNYSDVINTYKLRPEPLDSLLADCPIWICWFQGEKDMPPIVRDCYNSVKRHAGLHPINLITIDNYKEYVTIPQYIISKLENNEISYTHFSDVIRNNILADLGGIWLDATIYLTDELKGWDKPFYTIKQNILNDHAYVSGYKWTTFCMGGVKGNLLNSFIKDFFNAYLRHERGMVDYFLMDYIIALGYNNIPSIKKLIDDVPYSCPDLYYMQTKMALPVNNEELAKACQRTSIFKLTWKMEKPTDKHALYYRLASDNILL